MLANSVSLLGETLEFETKRSRDEMADALDTIKTSMDEKLHDIMANLNHRGTSAPHLELQPIPTPAPEPEPEPEPEPDWPYWTKL